MWDIFGVKASYQRIYDAGVRAGIETGRKVATAEMEDRHKHSFIQAFIQGFEAGTNTERMLASNKGVVTGLPPAMGPYLNNEMMDSIIISQVDEILKKKGL